MHYIMSYSQDLYQYLNQVIWSFISRDVYLIVTCLTGGKSSTNKKRIWVICKNIYIMIFIWYIHLWHVFIIGVNVYERFSCTESKITGIKQWLDLTLDFGWMDGWIDEWVCRVWMDEWMNELMDASFHRWMDK